MKYIVFIMVFLMGCAGNSNDPNDVNNTDVVNVSDIGKAAITFTSYEHDFGKIEEGEQVGCVFKFTNTGTSDLVVASASTTCGCTVPKYDVKPIPPGSSGTMEVIFDATGRSGYQTKTVTVKSNADTPLVILKISAEII